MSTDVFDAPDQQHAIARCRQCGQLLAEYWRGRGWDFDGRRCGCDRRPALPMPPGRPVLRV
jgi:hypothetical protein